MSGEPPQGFEKHESKYGAEHLTNGRLAEEIGEWFGSTGILDMRAYLRFRLLDHFKNRFLPEEKCSSEVISKEEIALNTLILDFALRHRYYFTVCLLLSEIQAFSKFDEQLNPLIKKMSSMTTEDFENLTPLLDRQEACTLLHLFGIDPDNKIGTRILDAYASKDRGSSLIQLTLSSFASSIRHADGTYKNDETVSYSSFGNGQQIKVMDDWIKNVNDQLIDIKLKVQQLECQRACSCEGECLRSFEIKIKDLSKKYEDVANEVHKIAENLQILTQLLDTIRLKGESAIKRYMRNGGLTLDMKRKWNTLEVSVARMRRRLVSENRNSKHRVIKRRLLSSKRRCEQSTVEKPLDLRRSDKAVQTVVIVRSDVNTTLSRAVEDLSSGLNSSANIPTDKLHVTPSERCDSSLENKERLILLVADRRREEDVCSTAHTKSFRNQSVSTELGNTQSLFTEQNVAAISDQNVEYREKIVHQAERIRCLTAKVAMLLAEIGGIDKDATPHTSFRDAWVNTDKSLSMGPEEEVRIGHSRQLIKHRHVNASPLIAAVKSAKHELAALKRERRNIEGE